MKQVQIMKKLDTLLFSKLDELKSSVQYQKISDQYSVLDENVQDLIKGLLFLVIFLIPFTVFGIFHLSNSSARQAVETKEELIILAQKLVSRQSAITREERQLMSAQFIDSQSQLKNKITTTLSNNGIDVSNIDLTGFDTEELEGLITKASANLNFTSMSSRDFFKMLNVLVSREKIKFEQINVKKSQSTGLLNGSLLIQYFSKDISEDL